MLTMAAYLVTIFPVAVPSWYVKHPRAGSVAAPSPPKPSAYPPAPSHFYRELNPASRG